MRTFTEHYQHYLNVIETVSNTYISGVTLFLFIVHCVLCMKTPILQTKYK